MSDISAQPVLDLGTLLSSYSRNQADIGQTQANTAFINGPQSQATTANAGEATARTGLIGMQTQRAALEMKMIQDAMAQANKTAPDNDSDDQSAVDPTYQGVATSLNKKLFVDPAGDPKLNSMIAGFGAAGMNPAAQAYEKLNALRVASMTARSQNEAVDTWETARAINAQNPDNPLQSLLSTRKDSYLHNLGKVIANNPDMTPEEKDAAARTALKSAEDNAYQYTGRKSEKAGSGYVDSVSGKSLSSTTFGLTPGEKLEKNKFEATPQTATTGNAPSTVFPNLANPTAPKTPNAPGGETSNGQTPQGQIPGLTPEQSDFVHSQKPGFEAPPGNRQLTDIDKDKFKTYNDQRKDLAKATSTEVARAQDTLKNINQINNLLQSPGLTLGPGSHEFSQVETVLNQWLGTSAGQAGAYQVLSKVLNASEMNDLLNEFHKEGAQVRLGAYESRLIMEKLAANPNLTKEAIQQMLQWQQSNAKYELDKANVAKEVMKSGKSVENFTTEYGMKFPKQDIVDTSISALNEKNGNQAFKFEGSKGKSYKLAEVKTAAAKIGMPLVLFEDKLKSAGATIN